jgi:arabinose-5-phosphate isomerase
MSVRLDPTRALSVGQEAVRAESRALDLLAVALGEGLREPFLAAAQLMHAARGRVIVTGMGKSGHIARKIAATLASTGRPAQFVHPAEASHGDLGMITADDVVLALSRSGETGELNDLIYHCRRLSIPLIGMTFKPASTLAMASDPALVLPDCGEASEAAPAPTVSTTMCLAMGDALAVALLDAQGFSAQDFKSIHPGGTLGAALKHVRDIMYTGDRLPLIGPDLAVPEGLKAMSAGGLGCVGVVAANQLVGVITDGDVRRNLTPAAFSGPSSALMTHNPRTIAPNASLADALSVMNALKITSLFVVEGATPVGVLHIQQLLAAGVR